MCGELSRLFLTQLALETDRKHSERRRGDFWRGYVPGVCVYGLALPRRVFVLLIHTSEQVYGVCSVLSRLILAQLALETDRKYGKKKGIF